jgi:hypothetical protein
MDLNKDLTRARFRRGHLAKFQAIDSAKRSAHNGMHGSLPPLRVFESVSRCRRFTRYRRPKRKAPYLRGAPRRAAEGRLVSGPWYHRRCSERLEPSNERYAQPLKKGDLLKKAFFLVVLSLLLPMALIQTADAGREVTAKNETPYTVKGTITYATVLCRNDHPTIAPGATFQVGIGACLTQKVNFSADGQSCELMGGRPGNPTSFVIKTGAAFGYKGLHCGFTAR